MKIFMKATIALALAISVTATTKTFADDGFMEASKASDAVTAVVFSGNPENSYIFLGGTSYSLNSTSNKNNQMKQAKEAIIRDANAYALTGEMGVILGSVVKNIQNQNPDLSDEEAVNYLLEAIQN